MNLTEQESRHQDLHNLSFADLLMGINTEDMAVALAVQEKLSQITVLCELVYSRMSEGGRLFYLGAGTSGRLGIVDASELELLPAAIPPSARPLNLLRMIPSRDFGICFNMVLVKRM